MNEGLTLIVCIPLPSKVREELLRHNVVLQYHSPALVPEKLRIAIGTITIQGTIEDVYQKVLNSHLTFFKSKLCHLMVKEQLGVTTSCELLSTEHALGRHIRHDVLMGELGMIPIKNTFLSLSGMLVPQTSDVLSFKKVDVSLPFLVTELEIVSAGLDTPGILSILTIALEDNLPLFRRPF